MRTIVGRGVSTSVLVASILCSSVACGPGGNESESESCENCAGSSSIFAAKAAQNGGRSSGGSSAQSSTGADGTGGTSSITPQSASSQGGASSPASSSGTAESTCSGTPESTCSISDDYGVFVSAAGNDISSGKEISPVKTLRRALEIVEARLGGKKRSIYVCATAGALEVDQTMVWDRAFDGVTIYGGFDCHDETAWSYKGAITRSRIVSKSPVALKLVSLKSVIHLENLSIVSADATTEGDSSIAMMVLDSPNITLTNVELIAGKGAAGKAGTNDESTAASGTDGKSGLEACTYYWYGGTEACLPGGAVATTTCGGKVVSKSGSGGCGANNMPSRNVPLIAGPGESSPDNPSTPTEFGGFGGKGQADYSSQCTIGKDGAVGRVGAPGVGAKDKAILTSNGYRSASGAAASDGLPGQGGGGGGGALPATDGTVCGTTRTDTAQTGGSGGSGGSGGCGGKGGVGADGGGASIALALINSPITLVRSHLIANAGGAGGRGGQGQKGGVGGRAGAGGVRIGNSKSACAGGKGGNGGNGGPGGGGAGGDSISIAYVGAEPSVDSDTTLETASTAAPGGLDGNNETAAAGKAGALEAMLKFDDVAATQ